MSVCIPLKNCSGRNGVWQIVSKLGEPSAFGELWAACCVESCSYVLKYQRYGKIISEDGSYSGTIEPENIENEVHIQNILASKGIAPTVIDWWHCSSEGAAIVMNALKETVASLLYRYTLFEIRKVILEQCVVLVAKIHSLGYYHGDIHLKNIMVDYDPSKKVLARDYNMESFDLMNYRFYLIDFGLSGKLPKNFKERAARILADYNSLVLRFEELVEIEPTWIRSHIDKYLEEYGLKMK